MAYSRDSCPKYREAYPRLDILKAAANVRRGRSFCVQKMGGGILGVLRFKPNQDWTEATVTGELVGRYIECWDASTSIELGADARTATCPSCGKRVQILVFTDRWRCATCADLHYRRQLVDRAILLLEELYALWSRPKGRPKGMHQRTFRARETKAVERIKAIKAELKGRTYSVASKQHRDVVEAEWCNEEEFRRTVGGLGFSLPDRPAS